MIACTSQLTDALSLATEAVSGELLAAGLIPFHLHKQLTNRYTDETHKANQLFNAVTTCIKTSASNFDLFITALKKLGDWTKDIIRIIRDMYTQKRSAIPINTISFLCL